jgi:scyllo-inositol 2-dehydrogenase (NADP+)
MANKKSPIRCAVVGYGPAFGMGKGHGEWLTSTGAMKLVAACDTNPACIKQAKLDYPDINGYPSLDAMLVKEDFDLAVIITPHNTHAKLAAAALRAGKHVICEKPFVLNTKDATMLIELAKKQKVMLSVFHNRRWDADYLTLRKIIDTGVIGDIFHIETGMSGYGHPGTWWRSDKAISGGAIWDWGAHFTDWILCLMGEDAPVQDVAAYFHKLKWHDVTNEDHTEVVIRFVGGAVANLQFSSLDRAPRSKWRITGTEGAIVQPSWDEKEPILVYTTLNGQPAVTHVDMVKSRWAVDYYQNVADHLLRGKPLAVSAEQVRRRIAVLEAAEKSAISGKIEKVAYQ